MTEELRGILANDLPRQKHPLHLLHSADACVLFLRTIQDTLRHENPEMTLSKYAESSLESRLAAQDVMASAVLGDSTQVQ